MCFLHFECIPQYGLELIAGCWHCLCLLGPLVSTHWHLSMYIYNVRKTNLILLIILIEGFLNMIPSSQHKIHLLFKKHSDETPNVVSSETEGHEQTSEIKKLVIKIKPNTDVIPCEKITNVNTDTMTHSVQSNTETQRNLTSVESVPSTSVPDHFTFIDLFCGIGGFHVALKQLGGACKMASDIDPNCRQIYELNHGLVPTGDISEQLTIPSHDLLCGGFPCFIEGTNVLTKMGYKPIENVQVTDHLLTHSGKFQADHEFTKKNVPR